MKELETCPFATKMVRDKWAQDDIFAHMQECYMCKKIAKRIDFEIKHQLGFDLRKDGQPSDAVAFVSEIQMQAAAEGKRLSSAEIVLAVIRAVMQLAVDLTYVRSEEELKERIRDALRERQQDYQV